MKIHAIYLTFFTFLAGLSLLFGYLCVVTLFTGIEESLDYLGWVIFYSSIWGILAIVIAYFDYEIIKLFLEQRDAIITRKVPEVCFECQVSIQPDDVIWIGSDEAECPNCGVSLKVKTEWD